MKPLSCQAALCLLLPLLTACEPGGAGVNVTLRDSAGIWIAENPSPYDAPLHTVSGPLLTIGQSAGQVDYELHDVNGVLRLSDGTITVATGGNEIRWFDDAGLFRGRVGGDGSGPGEFRRIRYIAKLSGDSLLVFDSGNRRVSVIAPGGEYVRSVPIGLDQERPVSVAGALGDGTLLTRTVLETPRTSTPLYRSPLGFEVVRGTNTFTLPRYHGPEAALHADEGGGDISSVFISILPFARSTYASAGPRHFFVGSSETYQIDVWNETGQLVGIIRAALASTPVTRDILREYVSGEVERMRQNARRNGRSFDEAEVRRQLNEQAHAPAVPAYAALLATADGGLWVKAYPASGAERDPEQWFTFDTRGRIVARIELPAGFTPTYIEGRDVLGVFRDSLDVPYVHSYVLN